MLPSTILHVNGLLKKINLEQMSQSELAYIAETGKDDNLVIVEAPIAAAKDWNRFGEKSMVSKST